MRARRGFTLVELLVVLALVGMLVTLVPLAFERLRESAQYRDAVRAVLTDIRQARSRAQSEGREIRFGMDLARRTYGLEGQPPRVLPEPLQLRATVASVEIARDRSMSIRFLPGGGATGGSIDILRPGGAGTRLTVDWLSGTVSQAQLQQ